MKIVPVIKCSDLERSLDFYTRILDFNRKWPGYEDREMANGVIDLVRDGAELQLSRHAGDGVFGSLSRVFVDDVDERYRTFRARGLDTTKRPESPIHTAPSIRPGDCASSPSPIPMATASASACSNDNCNSSAPELGSAARSRSRCARCSVSRDFSAHHPEPRMKDFAYCSACEMVV